MGDWRWRKGQNDPLTGWKVKVFEVASSEKGKIKDVFKVMYKQIEHYQTKGRVELCFNWDIFVERERGLHIKRLNFLY